VTAHRQPAAGFKIQDAHVCAGHAGLSDQSTGHIVVAARLVGQQFAEPVLVVFHIDELFRHGFARYMGKAADYIARRLTESMSFYGSENFF